MEPLSPQGKEQLWDPHECHSPSFSEHELDAILDPPGDDYVVKELKQTFGSLSYKAMCESVTGRRRVRRCEGEMTSSRGIEDGFIMKMILN